MSFLSRRLLLKAAGVAAGAIAVPRLAAGGAKAADAMAPALRQNLDACTPPGDPLKALLERNQGFSKVWQSLAAGSTRSNAWRSSAPCSRTVVRSIDWPWPKANGLGRR
jgi:hypothetical protein